MDRKTLPPREPYVTKQTVAEHLDVPERTLGQWDWLGTGPPSYKIGHHRRYRLSEVDAWVASRSAQDQQVRSSRRKAPA